jgi:hypothetical protein
MNDVQEGAIWLPTDGRGAQRLTNGEWVPVVKHDRHNPNDPFWKDAEFGTLDASFCFLTKPKTRDTLIYLYGAHSGDPLNTYIPGMYMDRILHAMLNPECPSKAVSSPVQQL